MPLLHHVVCQTAQSNTHSFGLQREDASYDDKEMMSHVSTWLGLIQLQRAQWSGLGKKRRML